MQMGLRSFYLMSTRTETGPDFLNKAERKVEKFMSRYATSYSIQESSPSAYEDIKWNDLPVRGRKDVMELPE